MKKGGNIYSPAITNKGKQSQSSFKPVKPGAPGASKKSPRASSHKLSSKKKKSNKKKIIYDDYLAKVMLEGSLGQGEREIQYKIHDPGKGGSIILNVHVMSTSQTWNTNIPIVGDTVELIQAWRRAPFKRDWPSLCQGILVCADIEFSDGVILNVAFNGGKFQSISGQMLRKLIHETATQLQLAWLCCCARAVCTAKRSPPKKRRKNPMRMRSKLLDEFKFGTAAESMSLHESDFTGGLDESLMSEGVSHFMDLDRAPSISSCQPRVSTAHKIPPKSFSAGNDNTTNTERITFTPYQNSRTDGTSFSNTGNNIAEVEQKNPFPGSGLELESAQELIDIRNHLDSVLEHMKSTTGSIPESSLFPNSKSIISTMSTEAEGVVEEVHTLQVSLNQQSSVVEELKQQFQELKDKTSRFPEEKLEEERAISALREEKEELKKELHALREAQSEYEKKNEHVMSTFLKAMEKTSQLAEEIKDSSVNESKKDLDTIHSTEPLPPSAIMDQNLEEPSQSSLQYPSHSNGEYERLKAKVEKDQLEKEVDISFLKMSLDKLTRGLKQSKVQYEDLEIESKRQHDRLKQELLKQKQEYSTLQQKLQDLDPSQQAKKKAAETAKAFFDSLPSKDLDEKFQKVFDHAVSKGDSDRIKKLREFKMNANRKCIYSSLTNIKYLQLLRSVGETVLTESQYEVASDKERMTTIKQLQQIKRVSRFLNFGALRWRLQKSDPSYEQLAASFIEILSTEKSAATLSDALRLGVRLRHEDLTVLALDQIYNLLTQAYEKNRKYFAPTLYILLGDVSYLALVMQVFFMSSRVQQQAMQVMACIFVSSRTPEELENNVCPKSSGLFEATIRVFLWHSGTVDLCINALKVAKRFLSSFPKSKEVFCKGKQIKILLNYGVKTVHSSVLFEDYVSLIAEATVESLPLVLKFSEAGLSSQFSQCLESKHNDELIVSIISKFILSLFSTHGPIFIQEMFGNKEFFTAILKCLSSFSLNPKIFKLVDMCFLAVCGQNIRIISRIPEKNISELIVKVLDNKEMNALTVMPTLMTINAACMSDIVLKEFYACGLHTIIKRALFDSNISEVKEYARKTHRIIADVDQEARLAEEEKEEQRRIEEKQAEKRRVAELEEERQKAAQLVEEFEKSTQRVGKVKDVIPTDENAEETIVAVRIRARQDAEKKAQLARDKENEVELARLKAEEDEKEARRKAAEVDKLRAELEKADQKAREIVDRQEAERVADALTTQKVTEAIIMEYFDEEIEKMAQKEYKREQGRLEKLKIENEATARIAEMKAQFDAAERSALLSVELEKAEQKALEEAELQEAEQEESVKKKQEEAEKIADKLFVEDMNRKSKQMQSQVKEERMIHRILSQQQDMDVQNEHDASVANVSVVKGPLKSELSDKVGDDGVNEKDQKGGLIIESSSLSPSLNESSNEKVTEDEEMQRKNEKAERKLKRKQEKEAEFLAKVKAKKDAKKAAKRKARQDEAMRKAEVRRNSLSSSVLEEEN